MSKKKLTQEAPATAPAAPTVNAPKQPANLVPDQIQSTVDLEQSNPATDQAPPVITQELEVIQTNQDQSPPMSGQDPVEQLPDQTPPVIIQELENLSEQPKRELTFEEKLKLKAVKRNAQRAAIKFVDALKSLANPDEMDDNPDRA